MTSFPKYPKYKASGVEWLGDVPEHWEVERLKGSLLEVDQRSTTGTETLLSLRMNVGLVPHNEVSTLPITSAQLIGYKKVAPGQVVMNRMRASSGIFAVATSHGLVSPDYAVFEPRGKQGTDFLLSLFKTGPMMTEFRRYSTGLGTGESGFLRLYSNFFFNIRCPIPPKAEENRIVAFLDEKTAEIDRLIAKKQRQIELLDEQKAILINRAVTRGLHPHAELQDSGIPWIGPIPKHWRVMKLKYLARINPSVTIRQSDLVTFLPMERVGSDGSLFLLPSVEARRLPASLTSFLRGDVLIAKITPCFENGKGAELSTLPTEKGMGSTEFHVLRPFLTGSRFLRHLTSAPAWRRVAECFMQGSAGQKRVTTEYMANSYFPIPPSNEQEAIATHIEVNAEAYLSLRQKVESQIQTLQTLRSTLIAHAVTGKIKVA